MRLRACGDSNPPLRTTVNQAGLNSGPVASLPSCRALRLGLFPFGSREGESAGKARREAERFLLRLPPLQIVQEHARAHPGAPWPSSIPPANERKEAVPKGPQGKRRRARERRSPSYAVPQSPDFGTYLRRSDPCVEGQEGRRNVACEEDHNRDYGEDRIIREYRLAWVQSEDKENCRAFGEDEYEDEENRFRPITPAHRPPTVSRPGRFLLLSMSA